MSGRETKQFSTKPFVECMLLKSHARVDCVCLDACIYQYPQGNDIEIEWSVKGLYKKNREVLVLF